MDRVQPGDTVPVFIEHNDNFRLPASADAPVIMVGPGTGVAPFRAFLQEREATGAGGRNWLLFGDRHFHTDFLYQTDWQGWLKGGLLTRMDVAFSRDQARKVYVQDRLRERGGEAREIGDQQLGRQLDAAARRAQHFGDARLERAGGVVPEISVAHHEHDEVDGHKCPELPGCELDVHEGQLGEDCAARMIMPGTSAMQALLIKQRGRQRDRLKSLVLVTR